MRSSKRKQHFHLLLKNLRNLPFKIGHEEKSVRMMEEFVAAYLGNNFIQGYRIFQQINDQLLILSALNHHHTYDCYQTTKQQKGQYRILYIDFREDLNQNSAMRKIIFQQILQTIRILKEDDPQASNLTIQIHFIFVNNHKFSVVTEKQLQKGTGINIKDFFERQNPFKFSKHSIRVLEERKEGTQLHELVQLFLKGEGTFNNIEYLNKQTLGCYKFSYNLKAVINTVCLIIGKQYLENGYITMTSEKWMRRSTMKKFKRFDLIMRREDKVSIIDWKFSKTEANEKINTKMFIKKNKQYFQLARKQYNAEVELKFYCIHRKIEGSFHKFTTSGYSYQCEQLQIQQNEDASEINDDSSVEYLNSHQNMLDIQDDIQENILPELPSPNIMFEIDDFNQPQNSMLNKQYQQKSPQIFPNKNKEDIIDNKQIILDENQFIQIDESDQERSNIQVIENSNLECIILDSEQMPHNNQISQKLGQKKLDVEVIEID